MDRTHNSGAVQPSMKALKRFRSRVREPTSPRSVWIPLPRLVKALNADLCGWKGYFDQFHRGRVFSTADACVLDRMLSHLQRRSQRSCRSRGGRSWYQLIHDQLGILLPSESRKRHPKW
jgi:hypothetical protein